MPKRFSKKGAPETHEKLQGFDIRINEFGQLVSTMDIDRLNAFLDEEVPDKKTGNKVLSKPAPEKNNDEEE